MALVLAVYLHYLHAADPVDRMDQLAQTFLASLPLPGARRVECVIVYGDVTF